MEIVNETNLTMSSSTEIFNGFENFDIYRVSGDIFSKAISIIGYNATTLVNFIAYKILHYNKSFDWISVGQLASNLNISKNTVRNYISKAVKKELIFTYQIGENGTQKTYYFLNTPTWKIIVKALKKGLVNFKDLLSIERKFEVERKYISQKAANQQNVDLVSTFNYWRKKRDNFYSEWATKLETLINLPTQDLNGGGHNKEQEECNSELGGVQEVDTHLDKATCDKPNDIYIKKTSSSPETEAAKMPSVVFDDDSLIQIKNKEQIEVEEAKAEIINSVADKTSAIIENVKEGTNKIIKKVSSALAFKNKLSDSQKQAVELIMKATFLDGQGNQVKIKDVSYQTAVEWAKKHDIELIKEVITNLSFRKGVHTPAGWIYKELEKGSYGKPKDLLEKEKIEQKQELTAKYTKIYLSFYNEDENSDPEHRNPDTLRTDLAKITVTEENKEQIIEILKPLVKEFGSQFMWSVLPRSMQFLLGSC